jgi:hypothetical protein
VARRLEPLRNGHPATEVIQVLGLEIAAFIAALVSVHVLAAVVPTCLVRVDDRELAKSCSHQSQPWAEDFEPVASVGARFAALNNGDWFYCLSDVFCT